jgi:hypothetical protein
LSERRTHRSWTATQKIEIVLAGLRGDRSVKAGTDVASAAARFGRERRTTGPATVSATSLEQGPVPAAKRPRTDRKARPPLGRKQAAHGSQQRSISGRIPRPLPSAPQDRQLVAQHHDLKLPFTTTAGKQANNPA